MLCLVLAALVGCGGRSPAPSPYAGAKLHGYPTPALARVVSDDSGGVYLVARGDLAGVADLYAASWRADGWVVADRRQADQTIFLAMTLGEYRLQLLFRPYAGVLPDGSDRGVMVHVPVFTRYN